MIIQSIVSSFKSKLQELRWTDQKSQQFVLKKVTRDASHRTLKSRFLAICYQRPVFLQVQALIPRLWTPKDISSEAELDLLFSKVHYRPALTADSKPSETYLNWSNSNTKGHHPFYNLYDSRWQSAHKASSPATSSCCPCGKRDTINSWLSKLRPLICKCLCSL